MPTPITKNTAKVLLHMIMAGADLTATPTADGRQWHCGDLRIEPVTALALCNRGLVARLAVKGSTEHYGVTPQGHRTLQGVLELERNNITALARDDKRTWRHALRDLRKGRRA